MKNITKCNGYFFISHSSMDLVKVRKIRNEIENNGGNPILFYLKCLDNDSPQGDDEKELKNIISREIKARHRFILCKSKYTEPPLCSKWIQWEKDVVQKLISTKKNLIQYYEIDVENDENYLTELKEIVLKQSNILIVAGYEVDPIGLRMLKESLNNSFFQTELLHESGDMREELTVGLGQFTKDVVKYTINSFNFKNKGIVLLLDSNSNVNPTFGQMVYTIASHHNLTILKYTLIGGNISTSKITEICNRIIDLINT